MAQAERNTMSVGAGQSPDTATSAPQVANTEVSSPIQGMSLELYNTLSKRHPFETIQQRRAQHKTHEDFMRDAEQEAERIRTVLTNARLPEEERFEGAGKLLGTPLSDAQKEALRRMHEVGKERVEAGVFKYTGKELGQKIKEGQGAFTREQIKALIRTGYAGKLTAAQFTAVNPGFNPDSYTDPQVKENAQKLKTWGDAGKVDEVTTARFRVKIKKLAADLEIDPSEADDLEKKVETWEKAAIDPLLPLAQRALSVTERDRLKEQAEREGGSEFSMAKCVYEYYMKLPNRTNPVAQQQLIDLRNEARIDLKNLLQLADQVGISDKARARGLKFYREFKAARRRDKWGRDKQQTVDYAVMQSYHEDVDWANSESLKPFESTLRGAGKYLFDGIVAGAYKELENDPTPHFNIVAKEEFEKIQEQRIRNRKKESKYDVNNYYGRRSYELAAENAAELPEAALELVRDRLAELPDTDMQTVDTALKGIRQEMDELLGTNRVHLEKDEEQKEVTEDNPNYKRAKAIFEAVTDVVGYEKIIGWDEKPNWENGGEVAASYVVRFAAGYMGHHDAIYLMRRVARILYKLRTHEEGTYWTGHPFSEEKVDLPAIRAYRQQLQKEIQEDVIAHELFITDQDFDKRLERKLDKNGKPEKGLDGREIIERDLRYSFEDNIEELLLDPGDVKRAAIIATGDSEALNRHDIRTKVFRDIKAKRDKEDELAGLTPEQRNDVIRSRIAQQMQTEINTKLLAKKTRQALDQMDVARQAGETIAHDKAMWQWVKEYDDYRAKGGLHIEGDADWYPSGWDLVRMSIDRPEKLVDRKLTDEQLDAMYEEADLDNLAEDEKAMLLNEVRSQFVIGRDYALLEMEDALYGGIRTRSRDPNTGEIIDINHKTKRVFDIIQERLETAITEEWVELENLKATMGVEITDLKAQGKFEDAKAKQIELDKKILGAQFLVTHALKAAGFVDGKLPVCDGQLRSDTAINFLAEMLAAYGVNIAFGKKISHNSKDWLYELLERGRRGWQSEKDRAVEEFMEGKYPDAEVDYDTIPGSPTYRQLVPQYEDPGKTKVRKAKEYRKGIHGEELSIEERNRIVNPGAPNEHQGIVDPEFNNSTSGGLAVPEFTGKLADYLFTVPMIKLGAPNLNAFHGVLKGLDEVQALRMQRIFTSNDAVLNEKERTAAYNTKKVYAGGKNAEGKSSPGIADEPFDGAYESADYLIDQSQFAMQYGLRDLIIFLKLMQAYRDGDRSYSEFLDKPPTEIKFQIKSGKTTKDDAAVIKRDDLEKYRQMTYSELGKLRKKEQDAFYKTLGGVFNRFQNYLEARKSCIQGRGGRALRSANEENHKAFYEWRRKCREAIMGKRDKNGKWVQKPEWGFIIRLGYSPEIVSEAAISQLETVLFDGRYHVLLREELPPRIRAGEDILAAALTDKEMLNGFQIQEKGAAGSILRDYNTFVIPDQREWKNIVNPDVRQALEKIRRRNLLPFMMEEGYKIYKRETNGEIKLDDKGKPIVYKEILGQGIPPLVQKEMAPKGSNKVINAFDPANTLSSITV